MSLVFQILSFNLEIILMTYAVTRKSFFLLLKRSRPMHSLKLVFSSGSDTRFVLTDAELFFLQAFSTHDSSSKYMWFWSICHVTRDVEFLSNVRSNKNSTMVSVFRRTQGEIILSDNCSGKNPVNSQSASKLFRLTLFSKLSLNYKKFQE